MPLDEARAFASLPLGARFDTLQWANHRLDGERHDCRAEEPTNAGAFAERTPRDCELLELIAGGLTNQSVADASGLSPDTRRDHNGHICAKIGVGHRAGVPVLARDAGFGRYRNRPALGGRAAALAARRHGTSRGADASCRRGRKIDCRIPADPEP